MGAGFLEFLKEMGIKAPICNLTAASLIASFFCGRRQCAD
jgi:hypothetical protein